LSLQSRRWRTARPVDRAHVARFAGLSPLVVQLLHNRGIEEPGAAADFLAGRFGPDNPFALAGMSQAVTRLRRAIRRQERMAVYGDFDTDGVTATALLVEALSSLGALVEPYIPHRVDEGYGLHLDALRELYLRGVRVVITVDCGIRSVEEVELASRGLSLIVTDHHTLGRALPPAEAVINPKRPDSVYPFRDLAGVGVAYKLAQALLRAEGRRPTPPELEEEALLDLVALGTVADLVPLRGENRALVHRGLERLNERPRSGVEALMAEAGLRRGEIDATAISFRLGPRLNAAGRIDTAMLAYRLLTSRDPHETRDLARQLDASIAAVFVVEPSYLRGESSTTGQWEQEMRHQVRELARINKVTIEELVRRGNPVREIVAAAADSQLLVIGMDEGRPGWFSIDVTAAVLNKAPCSVLLVT